MPVSMVLGRRGSAARSASVRPSYRRSDGTDAELDVLQIGAAALLSRRCRASRARSAFASDGSSDALGEVLPAAGQRPLRKQHAGSGARGRIRIEIERDVQTCATGRRSIIARRLLAPAPLRDADGLVMLDLPRQAGFSRDANQLRHRIEQPRRFIAHVRHVDAAMTCGDLRELDDLFGLRVVGWHVDQPGREPERALFMLPRRAAAFRRAPRRSGARFSSPITACGPRNGRRRNRCSARLSAPPCIGPAAMVDRRYAGWQGSS